MRTILAAALVAAAFSAAAQSTARPLPPGTVPLQEAPPPPAMDDKADPDLQPVVTTRQEGDKEIVEYRVKGKLYMQRVNPKGGKPYVLVDNHGDGTFMRQDNPLDNGVRVPQWVLKEF
ncbi:MAG: DUF2782 domain-containing protein [Usitatibacter sp.]